MQNAASGGVRRTGRAVNPKGGQHLRYEAVTSIGAIDRRSIWQ
jgi:hypothetical protein